MIEILARIGVVLGSFVGPLIIGALIVAWLDSCQHGGRKR